MNSAEMDGYDALLIMLIYFQRIIREERLLNFFCCVSYEINTFLNLKFSYEHFGQFYINILHRKYCNCILFVYWTDVTDLQDTN